jgi:hypothetical protein
VWSGHFEDSEPANGALSRRVRAGVPATDQMPAADVSARGATVSLGVADRPVPAAPAARAAARPVASLAIPRSGRGAWALGAMALAAVALVVAVALHGRGERRFRAARGAAAMAVGSGAAPPAPVAASAVPPAPPAVKMDDEGKKSVVQTALPSRHGRPARGLRFGANRAPLIE